MRTHLFSSCFLILASALGCLSGAALQAQETVTITEFLADNKSGLLDEDGEPSDWIEIFNSGAGPVDLGGWHLTDDPMDLAKWTFPSTNLPAKGFLLVFASGKNRTAAGAPLHTNFRLGSGGEYLALVHADGATIASEFTAVPEQFPDISYGQAQDISVTQLVASNADVKVLIPASGALGTSWTSLSFDDSSWMTGRNGVGYETTIPGFAVRNFKATGQVSDLATAENVIANASQHSSVWTENRATINYVNTGSGSHYGGDVTFPGLVINQDTEDFVLEATATVTIPAAGNWTFGVNSDDGFKLTVGTFTTSYGPPRAPADTLATFNFPQAGDYPLRLVFYERGGGSEVELFAAQGSFTSWNSAFDLVGDEAQGGLAVRSVPVSGGSVAGNTSSYRSLIATDVETSMLNHNASAYLRVPFTVANAVALTSLTLQIRYDDGFVAYLNGAEIARRNAPATVQYDSAAAASRPNSQALTPENINLTDQLSLLQDGQNVLAIQGLNDSASSSDFLMQAELAEFKAVGTTNHYFSTPSPADYNGAGFLAYVAEPKFSQPHGFYKTNFVLEITTGTPGATIRYTTNGTVPAPSTGLLYTNPLPIAATTAIRAAAFKAGYEPSRVATHTFLFIDDVITQSPSGQAPPGWPASWGANVLDYGMDPAVVNNPAYSPTIRNDLQTIPSYSIVMNLDDLFDPTTGIYANASQDGRDWERPTSVELIYPDGRPGFQVNAGIRIRGGFSRSTDNPKHAFRLFFRSEYGDSKLDYPAFGPDAAQSFDKFDLRTFQNYSWSFQGDSRGIFLRDQFNRDTQLAMGQPTERGDFIHLYINGQYWGLYNTDERPEASWGASYFGGNREDYDVIKVEAGPYTIEATDGNMDAWTRLYNLAEAGLASNAAYERIQGNNPDGTPNPAYENLLDVDNLIDYMLVILYGGNLDAPISNFLSNESPNNWYGIRNRDGRAGFRFVAHDSEHTLLDVNADRTGPFPAGDASHGGITKSSPQRIWQQLQANPEFRLRVADHIQQHFFNGGALTPEAVRARFLKRKDEIDRAVVGESARWGDAKRTAPFTRDAEWVSAINNVLNNFFPQRTTVVLNQLKTDALFPNLSAPLFSQYGGLVAPGSTLFLTNDNSGGTIYYTLDGSDPRLMGGAVSPAALPYSAPFTLGAHDLVRARVKNGTTWSALVEAEFYSEQDFSRLLVTEIMFHPPDSGAVLGDDLEFLELKNAGNTGLDLSGVSFTSGIAFAFTNGTILAPGEFFLLGRNSAAFAARYPGHDLNGLYTGKLDNAGEKLVLSHILGGTILSVDYKDSAPWPAAADGFGFSIVPQDASSAQNQDNPANWRASSASGGSPGADDPPANIPPVVINEALTHTTLPDVDAIELFNPTAAAADIGGWFLTDDAGQPMKFRIPPGTILPAGGYLAYDESAFNANPVSSNSFNLSSLGEEVYLFSADSQTNLTGYSHGFKFGAAADGVSFGRWVSSDSRELFVAQNSPTLGTANAGPRLNQVVIREIMYHPPDLPNNVDDAASEFIEVFNSGNLPVPLFDPAASTNTWHLRGGTDFDFPTNLTLAAHESLRLVNFDPADAVASAAFRGKYGLSPDMLLLGPYQGKLDNSGENVRLLQPDTPRLDDVPYLLVDEVDYADSLPWPAAADGQGAVLYRLAPAAFGNDPTNWNAGLAVLTIQADAEAVDPGQPVTFTVSGASSSPIRFQWRLNGANLTGATNDTLLLSDPQLEDAGSYEVVAHDAHGTVTSPSVSLRVLVAPAIAEQPTDQTALVGDPVTFSVVAVGTQPMGYRWRHQGLTLTQTYDGVFTIPSVQLSDAGSYDVIITNGITIGVRSQGFTLTVLEKTDADNDGLPDDWEMAHGLNPQSNTDAAADSDGDGSSNADEYSAGTDPQDPASYLKFESVSTSAVGTQSLVLEFNAAAHKSYSIFYRDGLETGPWAKLSSVGSASTNRTVRIPDPMSGATKRRFYRLVTPAQP